MRLSFLAVGCVLLAGASVTVAAPRPASSHEVQRFRLGEHGGGLGVYVDQIVVFSSILRGKTVEWRVERRRTDSNWCGKKDSTGCIKTNTSIHDWIEGKSCPALRGVMQKLPEAREAARREDSNVMVTDVPIVTLVTVKDGRDVEAESDYLGALAHWWYAAQQQLQTCWTDRPDV